MEIRQRSDPVLITSFGGRQYWWFHDHIYWDSDLRSWDDVKVLLLDREQRQRRQVERARSRVVAAGKEAQTPREGIPRDVRLAVWERCEGKCARCGSAKLLQFDHVIPLAMGGNNSIENLQLLCDRCNQEKGGAL
jgi:5-methylcytosine-specific restriction endonuclease McrA